MWLMIKLEFSYTNTFQNNIYAFLIMFMLMDIALENILVRVVMSEAILVSPILGSFSVIEFIMSMGANNFENFLISYFIETGL